MTEIKQETISIYVETLFTLAREAARQDRPDAFDFIRGHLVGLVPASALQAFLDSVPRPAKPTYRPAGNGNGGALVTNPVAPPRLPPSPTRLSLDDVLQASGLPAGRK